MWVVKLIKPIPVLNNDYRDDFFPRTYHYKRDAKALAEEVKSKGGQATVTKSEDKK